MKSFYEMLIIMEGLGEDAKGPLVRSSYDDQEKLAFETIKQALDKAGLPWDQEEFNVLYGKFVDMDIYVSPDRTQRVQGMVDADRYENDGDPDEGSSGGGGRISGFQINNKEFNPSDIAAIHSIRVQLTYDALFNAWREDWDNDRDYEKTLRMLPR
jgi:hypothetical protein